MPIISINPTALAPLADASKPVLDNLRRPTVNLGGVADAAGQLGRAGQMPMIDPGAFVAKDRALAAIGDAVGKAGGLLEAVAMKRAEAQNDVDIAEADARLEQEQADFEAWKQSHPDPRDWQTEWASRSTKALGAVLGNTKLSADAKQKIELRGKSWASRSGIMIARDATKETFARAKSSSLAAMDRASFAGDAEGFANARESALQKGYIFEHEGEAATQRFTVEQERKQKKAEAEAKDQQRNYFASLLDSDPFEAQAALAAEGSFPGLDAGDKLQMKHQAEMMIQRKQSEVVETLQDGVVMGELDDAGIENMAPVAKLGPVAVERLKEFRKKFIEAKTSKEPMSDVDAMDLSADIEKFNPDKMDEADALTTWVDLKRRADVITARGGEIGRQTGGVFNQRLYQLHPLHDRRKKTADLPDGVESDFNDLMRTYAPAPVPSSESGKTEAEKERARQEHRTFITQRSRLFEDLKKEVQTNPAILDPTKGGVDGWIANKWKGVRAASRLPELPGPDASLFPVGSADPNEMFKSILK